MVIDRIVGDLVVIEVKPGVYENVQLATISGQARDGAVIVRCEDGYVVDERKTVEGERAARARMKRLFEK